MKKAHQVQLNVKVLLTVLMGGVIRNGFLQGCMVNKQYNINHLHEVILRKQAKMQENNYWIAL